jgi:hypothetical protein
MFIMVCHCFYKHREELDRRGQEWRHVPFVLPVRLKAGEKTLMYHLYVVPGVARLLGAHELQQISIFVQVFSGMNKKIRYS